MLIFLSVLIIWIIICVWMIFCEIRQGRDTKTKLDWLDKIVKRIIEKMKGGGELK